MGRKIKKAIKKVIPNEVVAPFVPSPPAVVEPEPVEPPMVAEPTPTPTPKEDGPEIGLPDQPVGTLPSPDGSDRTISIGIPDPVVSDPVPVDPTPTETEETAQAVQRKKKGRKSLINTSSTGLGGSATVYTPTLLG